MFPTLAHDLERSVSPLEVEVLDVGAQARSCAVP